MLRILIPYLCLQTISLFIVLNNRKEPFEAPIELFFLHLNEHVCPVFFLLSSTVEETKNDGNVFASKRNEICSVYLHFITMKSSPISNIQTTTNDTNMINIVSFVSNSMSQIHLPLRMDDNEKFEEKKHIHHIRSHFEWIRFPFLSVLSLLSLADNDIHLFIFIHMFYVHIDIFDALLAATIHLNSIQTKTHNQRRHRHRTSFR